MIELRELAHALVDNLLTGFPNAALKQATGAVTTQTITVPAAAPAPTAPPAA